MRIALVTILLAACTTAVWVMIVLGGEAAQPGFHPDALPPDTESEIQEAVANIDRIEADALKSASSRSLDPHQQVIALGKLLLFDKQLSVNRNEACAFCHMPETGFTGPISSLNATTVAYPGSVRTRFSQRKPQTHTYATFAPILHYNVLQGDLVGGNFWDMRATGTRLGNPAAEQAQAPPLNAVEMGFADSACVVYRLSQSPYRGLFEKVWGVEAFAIRWPTDVERVCAKPAPAPSDDPLPVHLSPDDRGNSDRTYDEMGQAIAQYEASPEVSPFSSKYDYVQGGKVKFAPQEQRGYNLFRSSRSHCNECHRDGGPGEEPLFTDFTASNLGLPRNPDIPFYRESVPDEYGYAANPRGLEFIDEGVGGYLLSRQPGQQLSGRPNPNTEWASLAPKFNGKFQTPTLRNVDKRPRPDFVKAYMHNGYLKSLKEVVHFYNTRDALPRCIGAHDSREKVGCWPAPEVPANENRKQLGSLGLSDSEEDDIVAFLQTLTDGYDAGNVK